MLRRLIRSSGRSISGPADAIPSAIRPVVQSLEQRRLLAAGDLDPTWGAGGVLIDNYDGNDRGEDVVVQGDDKIVVGATIDLAGLSGMVVARYNADGTPDTNFDVDGVA
jgi:hypothetical protein